MSEQEWYTVAEVADLLRIDPQTVRRHLHAGRMKYSKLGPGRTSPIRIPVSELDRYLSEYKVAGWAS